MNGAVKTVPAVYDHAGAACAQMGMIVSAEKQVKNTGLLRSNSKKPPIYQPPILRFKRSLAWNEAEFKKAGEIGETCTKKS